MTPGRIRCGAWILIFAAVIGLPVVSARAQESPPSEAQDEPKGRVGPTTRPAIQPRNAEEAEALERLMKLKEQADRQAAEQRERGETDAPRPSTRTRGRVDPRRSAATKPPTPPTSQEGQAAVVAGEPKRQVRDDFVGPPAFLAADPTPGRAGDRLSPTELRERAAQERGERLGEAGEEPSGEESGAGPARKLTRRTGAGDDDQTDWFNFDDMPWEDVVMVFVERIGKPLMGMEPIIGGSLTYVSDRRFTKDEAIDELNLIMHEQGYRFVEQEHHVRVIPLSEMKWWVPISQTFSSVVEFEEARPRDMDYVVVYYLVEDKPAQALVDAFVDALPDGTLLSTVGETNQIKIQALARDVRRFLALKDKIDLSPTDPRKLKFFQIKTNARVIEQLLRDFLNIGSRAAQVTMQRDPRTGRMRPVRTTPTTTQDQDVQIVADDRTNSIIVKATPDKLEEISQLIEQFDQKPEIGEFKTTVVQVQHADAVEVANLLNQIFQQEQGESRTPAWQLRRLQQRQPTRRTVRGRQPTPRTPTAQPQGVAPEDILAEGIFERAKKTVRIVADSRMNALIIYANDEGLARVREMLTVLDQPRPDNFRVFALEHAEVDEISQMLTNLVNTMIGGGERGASIVPDPSTNSLYVIAELDAMEKVAALIEQFDVPGAEKNRHVMQLERLRPSEVASMIQSLLGEGTRTTASALRGRIRGGRRMPTRTATITDTPNYQLIPLDDAQILIVICTDEDWERIEQTVKLWEENALTSTPELQTFAIEKGSAQAIAEKLGVFYRSYQHPILGRSSVAIEAEGDRIMVYGVRPAIDEIAALIETLDVESPDDRVEILPLQHADATQVAQQLQIVLGIGGRRGRGVVGGPMIQAEPVTNSLIVQADKADMEKIKDFALRMDAEVGAQEPERKFFTPRYATARDLAAAIQQLYGLGSSRRGQPAGTQIKAFPSGNQVIVEAPKEKMAEIEQFIAQFDDPKGNEIVIETIKLEGSDVAQIAGRLNAAFRSKQNVTVHFDADPQAEMILLTCSRDALDEAKELIDQYVEVARGQAPQVEFRQMVHAQATDASNWLREQLITYMQQQLGRRAAQAIKVTADARTNRVVINGPEVAVKFGMALLNEFDIAAEQPPVSPMETVARKLPGLDVRTLANQLNQTFRADPPRPDRLHATFTYDATTETIIISAPKDMFERIDKIIAAFESETKELEPEQKFVQIENADANHVAAQLRSILSVQIGKTRGRGVADRINVTVEPRLNQIILNAPKFVIPIADELIARLDQPPTAESQLRTIPLVNADANTVGNVLRQIFSEKIRARTLQISVEPLSNSLIVGGSAEDHAEIERWAKDLDEQVLTKGGELQIVDVLNANPWEVLNILNAQYGARRYGQRSRLGQEMSFYVAGGRSVVVQAPKDKMPEILELIQRIDQVGVDKIEVRTYEIPGIGDSAHELARQVTNAINSQQQARERRISIAPYPSADTLIVTARTDQFEQIEEMMNQFKSMVEKETTVTKFVKLEHLDAGRYAGMIQNLLANKLQRGGRSTKALQNLAIMADARTNRLICYVPEKIVPDLEELVTQLDVQAEDYEGRVRAIELAHADCNLVAQTLRPMFEQRQNQRRNQDISQIIVRIQPEPVTNSLLVTASEEDFDEIRKQAMWMDEKAILTGLEPTVVELQFADPQEVANLINQWFGSRGRRGQSEAQEAKASVTNGVLVVSAPKNKMEEIRALIAEVDRQDPSGVQIKTYDLKVLNAAQLQYAVQGFLRDLGGNYRKGQLKPGAFAEPTTNTLVVMAPAESFPVIDQIITTLEGNAPKAGKAKSYELINVRAEQIARNVDAMLKAKVQEREGVKRTTVQTAVFAEPTSNRLFVYAPDEYQELAGSLIEMVDQEVESSDIVHIVTLENADAAQMAQSLQQVIAGNSRGSSTPGARSGTATVRITADASSNSIILAGMPKDVAEVEGWIEELEEKGSLIPELQIFQLEYALADEVEQLLQGLFPGGAGGRRGRGMSAQDAVTISVDEYANRLIVSANRRKMREVEATIAELDQAPDMGEDGMLAGGRRLYFVDINRGSASNIAWDVRDSLEGLFPPEDRGGPSVEADWFDEYLIVRCRAPEFPTIESLIRQFEIRTKVDVVEAVYDLRGDVDTVLQYLSTVRADVDDLVVHQPAEPVQRRTLVEDLWGEDEVPPWKQTEQKKQKDDKQERSDRLGSVLQTGATSGASADRADWSSGRGVFRLAAYTPAQDPAQDRVLPPPTTAPRVLARPRAEEEPTEPVRDGASVASPVEKQPVEITVQGGRLILKGPRDKVDDLTDIIDLFQEERSAGEVIRIFRFRYGDVSAAAEVLSIMFDVRRQQIVIPQQQQQQRRGREGEEGREPSMMEQLRGMVGARGQTRQDQGTRLRIATDPGHNYLIIKCDEADLPEIRELLRELDIPPGEVKIEVFRLKNLLAEETAENIRDILGISKAQQRRGRSMPTPGGRAGRGQQQLMEMLQQQLVSVPGVEGGAKVEQVEIVPNAVTNSLLVSSPPEILEVIRRVINELEGLEGFDVVGIHHYDLKEARVDDVLPLLQEIFDATASGGGGRGPRGGGGRSPAALGPVTISGDPRTNTLIFTAEAKDVETVESQIQKLDIAGAVAEAETYVCQYGDAAQIAATLEPIYATTGGGGRGARGGATPRLGGSDVRIVAEPGTNAIIVWGPREKRDLIFAKIEELDTLYHQDIREIPLQFADAEKLAPTLMEIFGSGAAARAGGGGRRGGGGSGVMSAGRIMIMGDDDANMLLVRAPDEIYAQIEEMVALLDVPDEDLQLRKFDIRYADATVVVEQMRSALSEYMQLAKGMGSGADFDAFTAVPDARTNSVTVVGSTETFRFVEQVLGAIDVPTPKEQQKDFRIFALEYADATTVADAINAYATGGAGALSGGRGGRRGLQEGARELNVTAIPEEATNSVLVFGRNDDIDLIEVAVVVQLEDKVTDRYRIETIAVKNVPPSQIVSFIYDFIEQPVTQTSAGRGRGRGQGTGLGEGGPQIVPNDSGKTLIVRGTKRQIDEIRSLVERFDDPQIVTNQVEIIPVPYGQDPFALAADLQTIINDSEQRAAELTGRRPRQVTIAADDYTHTLIVAGDPTAFGMVKTIMQQLGDVRRSGPKTVVLELNALSSDEAVQLINEIQEQDGRSRSSGARRPSSGTRRRSSTPSQTPSRRRGTGGRGAIDFNHLPDMGVSPALLRPYIGVGIFSPMIGVAAFQPPDDEPRRRRAARNRDEEQPIRAFRAGRLPELDNQPQRGQEPPPEPAQPPEERPSVSQAEMLELLSGVSGQLKGEVTATALDSQRLIITGDEDDVAFITRILTMMEQSKSPAAIEVFALENAKATVLAPIIENVIQSEAQVRGADESFSISAEGRSNSLIVSASEAVMSRIEMLIERLDVERGEGRDVRTVLVENMRAAEAVALLKPTLERMNQIEEIPKEAQALLTAVERNNSIMIVGTPNEVDRIERLIHEIDVELTAEDEERVTTFTTADVILLQLKNGNAENVAKVLTDMIEEQQKNAREAGGDRPGQPFVKVLRLRMADGRELPDLNLDRPIKIIAEKGTNSLIIFSSKENNEALTEIVRVFDTLPIGEETDVKVFALQHAAAEEVASLLEEVFKDKSYLSRPSQGDSGPEKGELPPVPPGVAAKGLPYPLVVQSDVRSNTVIIIGRKDAVILAGGLISELDRPTRDLGMRAFVLGPLEFMRASSMSEKIDELLSDRAKALGGDKNEARDSAVVKPEERSNSLIIFASQEMYDLIEDLVLQLDTEENKFSAVSTRYRALRYADAQKLQGLLDEMFTAKADAEKQINKDFDETLNVLADIRSNSLLLTGTRDYLDEAETLLDRLDQEFAGTVEIRAFKIRLNSALNIASLLTEMIDKALKQKDSKLSGTEVFVTADPVSDSLLVVASREDIDLIERWVEILDRPSEVGRMTDIIPLRRASAEEAARSAQELFKFGGQEGEVDLTVTHDESTNSVVVFGPPALIADVRDFVRKLDGTEIVGAAAVQIFKLEQADAEVAGEILQRILEGEGGSVGGRGGGGGSRQEAAKKVMLIWKDELGAETLRALRSEITVLADIRTNSLMVTAPPESMPLMESMIRAIDVPPDAAKIRVFRLVNADAEKMVEMLKELFERETVGATGGADQADTERMLTVGGIGAEGGRQEIAFTVDIRTNSVIAAGTPGYLDLVEQMVLELDTVPIEEREIFVYSPRYMPAEALAPSLRDFSDEERQRLEEIGDDISTAVLQQREVTAIANEDSNRLIVGVDPRFKSTVMQVIDDLDRPIPQVMIQVLILEVTLSNELEIGVEFAFQDLQWSDAGQPPGARFDYVGGTDVGAAGSGLGGFTFTITGADFNFLFRTLQSESSLRVLSRPQIVAMDNKPALIDISDDVPYVTGTQTSSTGQISTAVSRKSVGIVLEVTPQINPDGFVRMEVRQEVSDLTDSTVEVGPGVTSPIFFSRVAETSLMVKDNETVVLGGLIVSRSEQTENKVPIVGDIPLLGTLFRYQNDETRRAELLIVMTPHVIRSAEYYRSLSLAERDNMVLIPEESLRDPFMQGLRRDITELDSIDGSMRATAVPLEEPVRQETRPTHEAYGPLAPELQPDEKVDPDSYDIPITWMRRRGM